MTSKFVKTLAAVTLAGTIAASPALAGGGWGYGGWGYGGHRGPGWGYAAAAGLAGGLAIGALAAQPSYAGYYPAYGASPCYLTDQPMTDAWGNFVGYRKIRVCE